MMGCFHSTSLSILVLLFLTIPENGKPHAGEMIYTGNHETFHFWLLVRMSFL